MNYKHYAPSNPIPIKNREWPQNRITEAPKWCSVDLRDGNQSLPAPMTFSEKVKLFNLLCDIGFKDIEISFPSSSQTEYHFTRFLIENDVIPDDVRIQVMTNANPHLIRKTFESIKGAQNVVVHFYVSLSPIHREEVYKLNEDECIEKTILAAKLIRDLAIKHECEYKGSKVDIQYSAESFSSTEPDFAIKVCDEVVKVYYNDDREIIINLCNTVEVCSANYYADLVEYFCKNSKYVDKMTISIHSHNDRGTAVASTELALLAGGERVEGTLFGSGERAGNLDLVNLALNLLTQGIDPKLDFSNIKNCIKVVEETMHVKVAPRQPYSGRDIFATFSGTHQDAIRKYFNKRKKIQFEANDTDNTNKSIDSDKNNYDISIPKNTGEIWQTPYLPIDPKDLGIFDENIIRINSQSGRSGIHFIMEEMYGLSLPAPLLSIFSNEIKNLSEKLRREMTYSEIYEFFCANYINLSYPLKLISFQDNTISSSTVSIICKVLYQNKFYEIDGVGHGLLDAMNNALNNEFGIALELAQYTQVAMEESSKSRAISYLAMREKNKLSDKLYYGVGGSSNLSKSSLRALCSCINRFCQSKNNKNTSEISDIFNK